MVKDSVISVDSHEVHARLWYFTLMLGNQINECVEFVNARAQVEWYVLGSDDLLPDQIDIDNLLTGEN